MKRIRVVGEDALCCALGERLVAHLLPDWIMSGEPINTHGITKLLPSLVRYEQQARYVQPVLCIADTDRHCPIELLDQWMPQDAHHHFLMRFAVAEAESWILADREGTASFFETALKNVPSHPEDVPDAKRTMLWLARRSGRRTLRQEMVSQSDINKPGTGYNLHLCNLIANSWQPSRAAEESASLQRALSRLISLNADY